MYTINETRLINYFLQFVQIQSQSKHEEKFANYLKNVLSALNVHVIEHKLPNMKDYSTGNLICTLQANDQTIPTIFFNAHMDTVAHDSHITPMIVDDYIVSDGRTILGADDKAAIAVLIELIHYIRENNVIHGDIQFLFTVGEESGLIGAKALDRHLIRAPYGFTLDAEGQIGTIITEAPHQVKLIGLIKETKVGQVTTQSAMTLARRIIAKLNFGHIDEYTSVNMDYFKGDIDQFDCHHFAEIVMNVKSYKTANLESAITDIKQTFEQVAKEFGAKASVKVEVVYPGYKLSESDEVVKIATTAAKALQLESIISRANSGSDANILNNYQLPTVNIGVGYEFIHTNKERIHIKSLLSLTQYVISIVNTVANRRYKKDVRK